MNERKVFISHSSKDKTEANDLVAELEVRGVGCWITPRDVPPGEDYDEAIIAAIVACQSLVVLVSSDSIASRHVRSEVARASSEGKTIYPVRLIDIELAGGLQFHLELSQWIDFFPSPTTESYDALADAIRSGKPARIGTVRPRFNPRRWTLTTLGGMAVLIFGALGANWGYNAWEMRQATREAEEQLVRFEAEKAERERERLEAALGSLDVNPIFLVDETGFYLRGAYLMQSIEVSNDIHVEVVVNGGTPVPFPVDGSDQLMRLDISSLSSLTFRILGSDGELIREVNKTEEVRNRANQILQDFSFQVDQVARNEDRLTCFVTGCSFSTYDVPLCHPAVIGVAIEQGDSRHEVDSTYCSQPAPKPAYCLAAQDFPFRLVPGENFEIVFRLIDHSERRIERTIYEDWPSRMTGFHFREVPPTEGQTAPVLVATYEAPGTTVGGFYFSVGWAQCSTIGALEGESTDSGYHLLVDMDAKGFIRLGRDPHFFSYFNPGDQLGQEHPNTPLRLPAGSQTISIALGDETGIRVGPWTYAFDPADVVLGTAALGLVPEVACSRDRNMPKWARWATSGKLICIPVRREAFFDVASVEFGPSVDQFNTRIELNFDADEYLSAKCDPLNADCPPFVFEVPEGWPAVHSRVVMEDGRALFPVRHLLQE